MLLIEPNELRRDGHRVNFSGTSNEAFNRQHYAKLVELTRNTSSTARAVVFGCGAGYAGFYIAEYGFLGCIRCEDIDPQSVQIAKFISARMSHQCVRATFLSKGLKAAYEVAQGITQTHPTLSPMSFHTHAIGVSEPTPAPTYDLIIADRVLNTEFIGCSENDALYRIYESSHRGTILSCVATNLTQKILKLGFGPLKDSVQVFIRL